MEAAEDDVGARSHYLRPMPSRTLWLICGSGLLPFLVCLGIAFQSPPGSALHSAAVHTFVVYSALTLSFLGGARWGAELVRAPDGPLVSRMVASALPSIVGLAALLPQTAPRVALGLLMLSGGAQLAWDVSASRAGLLPAWNARVRSVMTALGTACSAAMWPMAS